MRKRIETKAFSTKTTYFLLSRDENGELLDFIGPLLFEEIETAKLEFEDLQHSSLEIIDELYFSVCFPDEYEDDKYHNWSTYLRYHLYVTYGLHIESTSPILPQESNEEEFALIVKDIGVIYRHCGILNVSFFTNTDPRKAAEAFHYIHLYTSNVYELKTQSPLYISEKTSKIFFGKRAYQQKNQENLLKIHLN